MTIICLGVLRLRFRGTGVAAKQYYVFVGNMETVFAARGLPSFPCDGDEALYQQISAGASTASDMARWRAGQLADAAQKAGQKRERAQRHQGEAACVVSWDMPCGPVPVRRPEPKRKVAVDTIPDEAAGQTDWSASDMIFGSDVGGIRGRVPGSGSRVESLSVCIPLDLAPARRRPRRGFRRRNGLSIRLRLTSGYRGRWWLVCWGTPFGGRLGGIPTEP